MDIFVQDGTLDKAVFSKPQWYLTSDSKVAYWVPGLHSYNDPTVTVELSITPMKMEKSMQPSTFTVAIH